MSDDVKINRGLKGVYFERSGVSDIDGAAGELSYRGYSIHDLAAQSTFEEVAFLLVNSHLPTQAELAAFSAELAAERRLKFRIIDVLKTLHKLGLDRVDPVEVRGQRVSPRDVVAAVLPNPADLTDEISGKTCAGTWVSGTGTDGEHKEVYLYHVVDNAESLARDGAQAVVWQTALFPAVAAELIAEGVWHGAGVLGPEAFDAVPFLDMVSGEHRSPWGIEDRTATAS